MARNVKVYCRTCKRTERIDIPEEMPIEDASCPGCGAKTLNPEP